MGYTVSAASTLLSVLSAAMPDPAAQLLLQLIIERVELLARSAQFTSEMTTHGLTLLEAHCICAYTCDAREFGGAREESPFFMCVPGCAPFLRTRHTRPTRCRYNKALREGDLEAVARWKDFSVLFGSGLRKLPALKCTVYRSAPLPPHCAALGIKALHSGAWTVP